MPDPRTLNVGDRIRFVSLPEEWARPGTPCPPVTRRFMNRMIRRTWPSRVTKIDEWGYPWITARIFERGQWHFHFFAITEHSGWRKVIRRSR